MRRGSRWWWGNHAAQMLRSLFWVCPEPAAPSKAAATGTAQQCRWAPCSPACLGPAAGSGTQPTLSSSYEEALLCTGAQRVLETQASGIWERSGGPEQPRLLLVTQNPPSPPEGKGEPPSFCTALGPWEEKSCLFVLERAEPAERIRGAWFLLKHALFSKQRATAPLVHCIGCPKGAA